MQFVSFLVTNNIIYFERLACFCCFEIALTPVNYNQCIDLYMENKTLDTV